VIALALVLAQASAPAKDATSPLRADAYVEASYSYNFNRPSNGVTAHRAFDNRHNTFLLSNAVLGATWEGTLVVGRVALQVGQTPASYYANAESARAAGAGVAASGPELWRHVQEANVGFRAPVGRGLLAQAGLFRSPIGPESIAVKASWCWSRSTLFYALPYYHAGLRLTQTLAKNLTVSAALFNGWNHVVDDNDDKSYAWQLLYDGGEDLAASLVYFGGNERPSGAPEGPTHRHLVDAWVRAKIFSRFWMSLHVDTGMEVTRFGPDAWTGAAGSGRLKLADWAYLAGRVDIMHERVGQGTLGRATPIFFPSTWVASGTATLDFRPADVVSARVEYRIDIAEAALYTRADRPTRAQDTITFGLTAWTP
jgi:hypothetical protein